MASGPPLAHSLITFKNNAVRIIPNRQTDFIIVRIILLRDLDFCKPSIEASALCARIVKQEREPLIDVRTLDPPIFHFDFTV